MTRDDVEHYEAPLVMKAARSMLPPGTDWDDLSYRRKQVLLDRAVTMLHAVLNDPTSLKRLAWLGTHSPVVARG